MPEPKIEMRILLNETDWASIMWNDRHGNTQAIVDSGNRYQFEIVDEPLEEE